MVNYIDIIFFSIHAFMLYFSNQYKDASTLEVDTVAILYNYLQ